MDYIIRKIVKDRFYYYLEEVVDFKFTSKKMYVWTGLQNNAMKISNEAKGWMLKDIKENSPFEHFDIIKG